MAYTKTIKATIDWGIDACNARNLARTSDGKLWCVYTRVDLVFCAYSSDYGTTWTEEQVSYPDDVNCDARNPSIAVDSSNNIHVVWSEEIASLSLLAGIKYRKRTTTWGTEVNISTGTGQDYGSGEVYDDYAPAIAIDSSDYIHVAWRGRYHDVDGTKYSIVYRKYTTSWQTGEVVATGTAAWLIQSDPTIGVDSSGNVHVAWYGNGWGTYPLKSSIQYAKRITTWTQTAITDVNYGQLAPVIAIGSDNSVHLVWGGGDDGNINIQYKKDADVYVAITTGTNNQDPSISLESNGDIHVTWVSSSGDPDWWSSVKHRAKVSGSWGSIETLVTADASYPYSGYPNLLYARYPASQILSSDYKFKWEKGNPSSVYDAMLYSYQAIPSSRSWGCIIG